MRAIYKLLKSFSAAETLPSVPKTLHDPAILRAAESVLTDAREHRLAEKLASSGWGSKSSPDGFRVARNEWQAAALRPPPSPPPLAQGSSKPAMTVLYDDGLEVHFDATLKQIPKALTIKPSGF